MEADEQAAASKRTSVDPSGEFGSRASSAAGHERRGEAADRLKDTARRMAEDGKSAAADRIGGMAQATDSAAGDLADQIPQAADALHGMAKRLEAAASALRQQSMDQWINSADQVARSQPIAFFAGAMLTGFALSRFLKSSGAHGER